jgi:hypothetical protein
VSAEWMPSNSPTLRHCIRDRFPSFCNPEAHLDTAHLADTRSFPTHILIEEVYIDLQLLASAIFQRLWRLDGGERSLGLGCLPFSAISPRLAWNPKPIHRRDKARDEYY